MKTKARLRGMLLASLAASLWSISGISGEILFKEFHFSADWLVSVRTAVSGILLLIAVVFIEKKSIFKPFKRVEDIIGILLFGIAGIYFVQFTYFRTIELSNVSFATILQFTAPFFIFIYESVKNKSSVYINCCFTYYDHFGSCVHCNKREFFKFDRIKRSTFNRSSICHYDCILFHSAKTAFKKIWKYYSCRLGNVCRKLYSKYNSSLLES